MSCPADFLLRMKTKLYPRFSYEDRVTFKGKLLQPVNFDSGSDRSFDYKGYLAKDDIYYEMKSAVVGLQKDSDVVIPANTVSFPRRSFDSESLRLDERESSVESLAPYSAALDSRFRGNDKQNNSLQYNEGGNDKQETSQQDNKQNASNLIENAVNSITSYLYQIKRQLVTVLEKTLGEPHAALAAGLVVGEKAALGKDLLNDFRIVGLIHIVVLSGYNITIVGDALRKLLSFLPRVWGITIGGMGISLFGILVGGGATVVRSCFMAGVALSADLIRRDYSVIRALVFAGLIMIIQNPLILLHDPSFQLSFLATLGLILLASPIEKRLGFIPEKFGLRGIVASTLATQIFVSPFILYMMGQISIIGMVVNILVLPFIPVTMLFVSLTGFLGMIYLPLGQIVAWGTYLLLSYELFMVGHFARLPFAAVHIPAFSGWWVVGFYLVFMISTILIRSKKALVSVIPAKAGIQCNVKCKSQNEK